MSEPDARENQDASPGIRLHELIHFKIGRNERGDPEDDGLRPKGIGTYRSERAALAAVERLRPLVGFRRWPDGFRIYPVDLDRFDWPNGFTPADADRSYWEWPKAEITRA